MTKADAVGADAAGADAAAAADAAAGAEEFDEAVEVAAGVTIYSGLDCTSAWRWASETKNTTLAAAAGTIPLMMRSSGDETNEWIEDPHVQARAIDAGNVEMRGSSSFAAVTARVNVELARCVVEAGDAAPGTEGVAYPTSAMSGAAGNAGNDACSAPAVLNRWTG